MIDTRTEGFEAPPVTERVTFALRQAVLLAVSLLVAGFVTERLRPADTLDRGMVSTPFLWAIVIWTIVLLLNAIAFETSQLPSLERTPLYAATAIGAVVLLIGLVSLDAGSFGRRFVYLFATSVGAIMFWWSAIGLAALITRRLVERSGD